MALGLDMREVSPVEIGHRQLTEDIVENGRGRFDRIIALHHARRLELGEGEGVDKFLQRHAILQAHRNRDGEIVHHRAESRTFLVHVDKDFAKRTISILAGPQVNLMAPDDGLLGIPLAALRHLFAFAVADFADDDLLDNLLGQNLGLFLLRARGEHLRRLLIIIDQRRGQRLRQFRSVPVKRIGLDPQRP